MVSKHALFTHIMGYVSEWIQYGTITSLIHQLQRQDDPPTMGFPAADDDP
jgi:hypothetical protein